MLEIVFENEHFVVVNKHYGVLSVVSRHQHTDTRPVLTKLLQQDRLEQIYPVHRLDFETQGLIMYAKNSAGHKVANSWFEKKIIVKHYSAWSVGTAGFDVNHNYEWESKILRGKRRAYEHPMGQMAKTKAKLVLTTERASEKFFLWELQPVTGRSHQLRFELSKRKMPILGDTLYQSQFQIAKDKILLLSYKLIFPEQAKQWGLPLEIAIKPFSLAHLPDHLAVVSKHK